MKRFGGFPANGLMRHERLVLLVYVQRLTMSRLYQISYKELIKAGLRPMIMLV